MTRTIFPDDTARVRRTDPLTSHSAAERNDTAASRAAVLAEFAKVDFGLANFELEQRLEKRWSHSRIRSARSELADAGLLVPMGIYRLTPAGNKAEVWEIPRD